MGCMFMRNLLDLGSVVILLSWGDSTQKGAGGRMYWLLEGEGHGSAG